MANNARVLGIGTVRLDSWRMPKRCRGEKNINKMKARREVKQRKEYLVDAMV